MPSYDIDAFIWTGTGSPTTLSNLNITDDDSEMSAYFTNDTTEVLTFDGNSYTNPRGGTYELTFTDSDGDTHTEDFLLFYTGSNFIFAPLPGSDFDDGSVIDSLGGWQDWTSGFEWEDVTCFAAGTLIRQPTGEVAIESLSVGDTVTTLDGEATIRWIGESVVSAAELAEKSNLRPVRISSGSLGAGLPARDMLVSRQHCMLLRSKVAERMFGEKEVLVPAIKLTKLPGIFVDHTVTEITYFHLLLDDHKVIFAENAPSESLFTGPQALEALRPDARAELFTLFPDLALGNHLPETAKLVPPLNLQKKLVSRHQQNGQSLVTS